MDPYSMTLTQKGTGHVVSKKANPYNDFSSVLKDIIDSGVLKTHPNCSDWKDYHSLIWSKIDNWNVDTQYESKRAKIRKAIPFSHYK